MNGNGATLSQRMDAMETTMTTAFENLKRTFIDEVKGAITDLQQEVKVLKRTVEDLRRAKDVAVPQPPAPQPASPSASTIEVKEEEPVPQRRNKRKASNPMPSAKRPQVLVPTHPTPTPMEESRPPPPAAKKVAKKKKKKKKEPKKEPEKVLSKAEKLVAGKNSPFNLSLDDLVEVGVVHVGDELEHAYKERRRRCTLLRYESGAVFVKDAKTAEGFLSLSSWAVAHYREVGLIARTHTPPPSPAPILTPAPLLKVVPERKSCCGWKEITHVESGKLMESLRHEVFAKYNPPKEEQEQMQVSLRSSLSLSLSLFRSTVPSADTHTQRVRTRIRSRHPGESSKNCTV